MWVKLRPEIEGGAGLGGRERGRERKRDIGRENEREGNLKIRLMKNRRDTYIVIPLHSKEYCDTA
jgi:hypothetical protein